MDNQQETKQTSLRFWVGSSETIRGTSQISKMSPLGGSLANSVSKQASKYHPSGSLLPGFAAGYNLICIIDKEIVQAVGFWPNPNFWTNPRVKKKCVPYSWSFSTVTLGSMALGSNPLLEEVIVGIMLGDGWMEKQKVNARLRFEQSHVRTEFFFYLFEFFAPYCSNSPKLRERFDNRTNKTYKTWHFTTLSSPFFTHYYDLFYNNRKKIIPANIIDLMTPVALAFLIMCDGYKHNKGVSLATNSFSISENELLINALNKKFGFGCWAVKDHGKPSTFYSKFWFK